MNKKTKNILLIIILIIAVFFRFYNLEDNFNFSYDQGRDHLRVNNMIDNLEVKIVGTETDIPGIFSGSLYYYMLIPGQIISNGSPNASIYLLAFLNLLSIPLVYLITKELFKSKITALIACFIATFSYFLVNYSRYLSNASLLPLTTAIFFYGLLLWIKEKKNGFPLAILGWGLSTQADFFYIYLFVFILLIKVMYNPRIKKKELLKGFIAGLITFSTFIVAEIKFKFLGIKELTKYISQSSTQVSVASAIDKFINKMGVVTTHSFFKFNLFLSLLILGFMIYFSFTRTKDKKNIRSLEFVMFWLLSSSLLFGFDTGAVNVAIIINGALAFPIIILLAFFAKKVYEKNKFLFITMILLVFISNLSLYFESNWVPNELSYPGNHFLLKYEKQVLDYMYKEADNQEFSFCAVTQPAFINSTWAYLFEWYGENKYGYLPYWSGTEQNPQFSDTEIQKEGEFKETRFIIYEPHISKDSELYVSTKLFADRTTELIESKQINEFIIEKRRILKGEEREKAEKVFKKKIKQNQNFIYDHRYNCL